MKSLLSACCILFFTIANSQHVPPQKYEDYLNVGDKVYEVNVHVRNPRYDKLTLSYFSVYPKNQVQSYEIEFGSLFHYNSVAGERMDAPLRYNEREMKSIKFNDPILKYNFSHSVLTKGMPYDDFIKRIGETFQTSFFPLFLDIKFLNDSNILISTTSGLYLLKIYPIGPPYNPYKYELFLLKESDFEGDKLVAYYREIVSVKNDVVTLTKGIIETNAKQTVAFKFDLANKTLITYP